MKNNNSISSYSDKEKTTQLKSAIKEGIQSGRAQDFNPEKHLAMLKVSSKKNKKSNS